MMERFEFSSLGDTLVGNLFLPDDGPKGIAVITGPLTSVKEQAPGAYAAALAEEGFAALAFDHRHFGESAGEPRQYENPEQKLRDIQAATDALSASFPDLDIFAVGICAGGGYMAGAVAASATVKAFAGVAGFYHDTAQAREWMGDGYDAAIAKGRAAREAYETTGEVAMMPAVAREGERAMPMDEAFEFYGTARGGEETFPNYSNSYAVMSQEKVTAYDAQTKANDISVPTLLIHSENALSPMLARRFFDTLTVSKQQEWLTSKGQIDFYDDPVLIHQSTRLVAGFFAAASEAT